MLYQIDEHELLEIWNLLHKSRGGSQNSDTKYVCFSFSKFSPACGLFYQDDYLQSLIRNIRTADVTARNSETKLRFKRHSTFKSAYLASQHPSVLQIHFEINISGLENYFRELLEAFKCDGLLIKNKVLKTYQHQKELLATDINRLLDQSYPRNQLCFSYLSDRNNNNHAFLATAFAFELDDYLNIFKISRSRQYYYVYMSLNRRIDSLLNRNRQQKFSNLFETENSTENITQTEQKSKPLRTDRTEKALYHIAYDNREVRINSIKLSKPNFDSENDVVFDYIVQHPNRKLAMSEIESAIHRNIQKEIKVIIRDLGFKKELKELFFPDVSKTAVFFRNPVSKEIFHQNSLKTPHMQVKE